MAARARAAPAIFFTPHTSMTDCWTSWQPSRPPGALVNADGTLPSSQYGNGRRVTVLVDSRDRDYDTFATSSQFVLRLPEMLHNVTGGVLVSAELPTTAHVFSAARGNTTLRVTVNGTTRDLVLPDGNYTYATLVLALQGVVDAAGFGTDVRVGIDPASSKFSIWTLDPDLLVTVDCQAATLGNSRRTNWGLGYQLGFARDTALTAAGGVDAPRVASVDPESYVLVDIDELNGVSRTSMSAEGGTRAAFAKVPMSAKSTGQYTFYDKTLLCNELRPPRAHLDKLSIALRYHDGSLVDLNGGEWSATIELTCTQTRAGT